MHARQEADRGSGSLQQPDPKPQAPIDRPIQSADGELTPGYSGFKHALLGILIVAAWLLLCLLLRQLA
jgi:hypothetical protein